MKTKNVMIVGVGGQGSLLTSKLLGKLLLTVVRCFRLIFIPQGFELVDKLRFVFKDIFADRLDCL